MFEGLLRFIGRHEVDVGEPSGHVRMQPVGGNVDTLHRAVDGEDLHQVVLVDVARQLSDMEPGGLWGWGPLTARWRPGPGSTPPRFRSFPRLPLLLLIWFLLGTLLLNYGSTFPILVTSASSSSWPPLGDTPTPATTPALAFAPAAAPAAV